MGYQIKGLDEKTCSTSRYLPKYEPSRNGNGKSDFLPPSFPLPALTPLLWDVQGRGKERGGFLWCDIGVHPLCLIHFAKTKFALNSFRLRSFHQSLFSPKDYLRNRVWETRTQSPLNLEINTRLLVGTSYSYSER
jgi:hypothetical protein